LTGAKGGVDGVLALTPSGAVCTTAQEVPDPPTDRLISRVQSRTALGPPGSQAGKRVSRRAEEPSERVCHSLRTVLRGAPCLKTQTASIPGFSSIVD